MSEETTKKQRVETGDSDELAPEYRFDYSKSRPNRFAGRVEQDAIVVVLDPDVAEVFQDPVRVNSVLRAAIEHQSPVTAP